MPTRDTEPVTSNTGRRGPAAQIVAIVVIVLVAAGVVFWIMRSHHPASAAPPRAAPPPPQPDNTAMLDPIRTRQVGSQISDTVATVFSYDAARLDQHTRDIAPLLSGNARDQVSATFNAVRRNPAARTVTVATTVSRYAVTTLHSALTSGDTATALVLLHEQVRTGPTAKPQQVSARLLVTAHQNGVHWQLTDTDSAFHTARRPSGTGAVTDHGRLLPVDAGRQRDLMLDSAAADAALFAAVDAHDPAGSLARAAAVTTGALHDRMVQSRAADVARVRAGRVSVTATTVTAGATALNLDAGTAEVLVALNTTVTGQPATRPATLSLSMQRIGTRWLVANVAQVTG